jgi:hypothetical protein
MKKMSRRNLLVIVAVMLGIAALLAAPGSAFGGNSFVERTGQTECYIGGQVEDCDDTGQDGDLQAGGPLRLVGSCN